MLNVLPSLCRGCGKSSREVRFASKHECLACAGDRKQARAERIAARGPRLVSVREPDPNSNPRHLAWIRSQPCAVLRLSCSKVMHAHHVRSAATAGTGMKPSDADTVPLCSTHHDEFHRIGVISFRDKYGVDLRSLAIRLAAMSPHIKRSGAG